MCKWFLTDAGRSLEYSQTIRRLSPNRRCQDDYSAGAENFESNDRPILHTIPVLARCCVEVG